MWIINVNNWLPRAITQHIPMVIARVNSLSSNRANYVRHRWLMRWLVSYGPKPLPEPMGIWCYWHPPPLRCTGLMIITAIALPDRVRCGVRIMKSMSKCDAFLPLYWRVKGDPRSVDMPGARWSATHGCHSGIISWSPWHELRTSPIKYFHYFCFITLFRWRHKMETFSA